MLKALNPLESGKVEPSRAVLVMGNELAQVQYLSSAALSSQFLDYLEEQYEFVDALSPAVRDHLVVRLSRNDFEWEQTLRWRDRHPMVALDDGERLIFDVLAESRLFITTNNGTTFLESISLGVPTIIFWDTSRWEILESAQSLFDELATVGVFHPTPGAAAKHVSEIWSDVQSWWTSQQVVDAVTRFSDTYCRGSVDIVDQVRRNLLALARDE